MDSRSENTQLIPYEAWKVRQAVDALLGSTTPAGTINSLMVRAGSPEASPFERYAGVVLREAGAAQLADLPPNCTLLLTPPTDGRLARLTCTARLDESQWELVMDVENAINRLCCIADAIEDSGSNGQPAEQQVRISFLGSSFVNDRAGYRSARMALPPIGRSEQPSMGYFNEIDWRVLDHIAATAHPVFQATLLPNMHQAFMGASAPDGSDWDIRTRLAAILEGLELPLRFGYRFDVNAQAQAVSVLFTVPSESSFPHRVFDGRTRTFVDVAERIDDIRIAYAMRLACLLAAAAFGSGRNVEHAHITGVRVGNGAPLFNCAFERKAYVRKTLLAIDEGRLSDPTIRFDTAKIAHLMDPSELEYVRFDGDSHVVIRDNGMKGHRIEPHLDERELTDELKKLFHTQRICDIDTRHYFGEGGQAVSAARSDSEESSIAAIAHLERIAAELEDAMAPPDDNAKSRPLYCANPLARAVVSLLDDDLAIGEQAEAFLHGAEHGETAAGQPSYFRAPDALFHAHMGLSDLYERLGDTRGAETEADRCIALAPTTATGYFRKSDILASQKRYMEAANLLRAGLRLAVSPRDCALLYYHLALILWNTGRKREAVAVHVYTTSLAGEYAEKAKRVVANLRKRGDSPVIVYASPLAASREMMRARIPVAPSDAARTLIVKAAVGLSCANAPEACAPYAAALTSYFRDDRIIASACRSIIHGSKLPNEGVAAPLAVGSETG
ncbi:MAG: hypothetical protein IJ087_02480 [Eggerthellaceae bacterium]|nr:hypothetical protein [Eggerthellaceae bacterium]